MTAPAAVRTAVPPPVRIGWAGGAYPVRSASAEVKGRLPSFHCDISIFDVLEIGIVPGIPGSMKLYE